MKWFPAKTSNEKFSRFDLDSKEKGSTMDPNETWKEIAFLLDSQEKEEKDVIELKNLISDLFGWIKRGGFIPKELESLNKTGCLFVLKSMWDSLEGC